MTSFHICNPGNHSAHERPFFFCLLVISQRLQYSNATAASGQQSGAMRIGGVLDHTCRILFQLGYRDQIF